MNPSAPQPPFPWQRVSAFLLALSLMAFLCTARLLSQETPLAVPASATASSAPPEFTHLGQLFVLTLHRYDAAVETDEYVPKGETRGDWSQLLTVQRLRLFRASSPDEMITHLSKCVAGDPRARFSVLQQGRHSTVFSASLPPSDKVKEQRLVGIVRVDTKNPEIMDVLQFALAPARVESGVAEMILDSWKKKFLKQADALNGALGVAD